MQDQFQIILPATTSAKDVKAIQGELKNIEGIQSAGTIGTRGLDPGTVTIWFQVATAVLSAISAGVPLFLKIKDMIKKKKIAAAILKLPDGTEIAIENTTVDEIEQILKKITDT
jgi:hypothetical protein